VPPPGPVEWLACPQEAGIGLRRGSQRAQPHQVIRGGGEGDRPVDPLAAAMPQFAEQADRLQPAEDLLHEFPFLLADRVARMPRRTPVDRTETPLGGDVRREALRAQPANVAAHVVVLITADRAPVTVG